MRVRSTVVFMLSVIGSLQHATGQVSSGVTARPETRAVVEACRQRGRVADTAHTLSVFKAALEILKIKAGFPEIAAADPLTVEVAAMLHDIGGGGYANARPGAAIAREVLTSLKQAQGFSDAFIERICRIVETHHVKDAVKGKDDSPEWYVVILADTPKIYNGSPEGAGDFSGLIGDRIAQLRTMIQ